MKDQFFLIALCLSWALPIFAQESTELRTHKFPLLYDAFPRGAAVELGPELNYANAEAFYRRVLAIDERVLGPNHPDLASDLGGLASLYLAQGKYTEAEPLFKRSLQIREEELGLNHPWSVATALNNLAELYRAQKRYAEAEPLYKRSSQIREKVSAPGNPDVLQSLHNLAELYRAQGKYAEAEPFFERSLRQPDINLCFGWSFEDTPEGMQWLVVKSHIRGAAQIAPELQNETVEKLKEKFENRELSCTLTVLPDGSIANLKILHPSGSGEVDNRALDLIKTAAPFRSLSFKEVQGDQSYLIEFPLLTVRRIPVLRVSTHAQ